MKDSPEYIDKIHKSNKDMLDDYDRSFQTETIIDAWRGKT